MCISYWSSDVCSADLFIDNNWVESHSSDVIAMLNPSDGTVLRDISRGNAQDIDAAVKSARHACDSHWAAVPAVERGRLLYKVSQKLIERAEEHRVENRCVQTDRSRRSPYN